MLLVAKNTLRYLIMDLVDDYIKQNPEQWQQMLDKYPSLKQMGQIGPDTQFVRKGVAVHGIARE